MEEDEHQVEEDEVDWVQVAVLLRHKCKDFTHTISQYPTVYII